MSNLSRSQSPKVVLRISDGSRMVRQAFADFGQASRSAEAYAREGFLVDMMSATGMFLMDFDVFRSGAAAFTPSARDEDRRNSGGNGPAGGEDSRKPWIFAG